MTHFHFRGLIPHRYGVGDYSCSCLGFISKYISCSEHQINTLIFKDHDNGVLKIYLYKQRDKTHANSVMPFPIIIYNNFINFIKEFYFIISSLFVISRKILLFIETMATRFLYSGLLENMKIYA